MVSTNHPHQLSVGDNFMKVGTGAVVVFFVSRRRHFFPSFRRCPSSSPPPPPSIFTPTVTPPPPPHPRRVRFLSVSPLSHRFRFLSFVGRRAIVRRSLLPHRRSFLLLFIPGVSASCRFHHFPTASTSLLRPSTERLTVDFSSSFFSFVVECLFVF